MINAKIKCPYCQAVNPVDYNHKRCGCIVCHQTIKIHKAEVVEPPKDEIIYDSSYDSEGNKIHHTVKGMAICAMLLGSFGVDYFIYGKVLRGLVNILLCWTGGPFVLGIFRGFEIMALEQDQLQDYYDKKARF